MNTLNPHLSFINRTANHSHLPQLSAPGAGRNEETAAPAPSDEVSLQTSTDSPKVRLETLCLGVRVAREMVPGLPGMALAIVDKADVKDGRYQPEGGQSKVELPQTRHLALHEGEHPVAYVPTPVSSEWKQPQAAETLILTDDWDADIRPSTSQDLAEACEQVDLKGEGDVQVSLLCHMTTDQFSQVGDKTLTLIPKDQLQGDLYTARGEAPLALDVVGSHYMDCEKDHPAVFSAVEVPSGSVDQSEYDVAAAKVQRFAQAEAQAEASVEGALRENWVEGRLEEHGLDTEGVTRRMRTFIYQAPEPTVPGEALTDPTTRKELGALSLVNSANVLADARQLLGHQAVEAAKVARAWGEAERMNDADGNPEVSREHYEALAPHLDVMLEKQKPIVNMEKAHARGQGTTFNDIFRLDQALTGNKARSVDSPVMLLNLAAMRAQKMNPHLKEPGEANLRELKKQSEQMGDFLGGSSWVKRLVSGVASLAGGRGTLNKVGDLETEDLRRYRSGHRGGRSRGPGSDRLAQEQLDAGRRSSAIRNPAAASSKLG